MNLFRMVLVCLSFITASQSIATAQSLGADVKIEQIGPSLAHPWGISLIDIKTALITLRDGVLIRMNLDTGSVTQIANVPAVFARRQGGLLDVLTHKDTSGLLCTRHSGAQSTGQGAAPQEGALPWRAASTAPGAVGQPRAAAGDGGREAEGNA